MQGLDQIQIVPIDLQDRPAWYKQKVYPANKVDSYSSYLSQYHFIFILNCLFQVHVTYADASLGSLGTATNIFNRVLWDYQQLHDNNNIQKQLYYLVITL